MNLVYFFQVISIVLFSVILHECAHGWIAYKFGDPTAKNAGRLTLNPIKHIDPFGTLLLPAILFILHLPIIGMAKPVPVNFLNLRNPKRDMIWVGIAGPVTNFAIAIALSAFLRLNIFRSLEEVMSIAIIINLVLGVFNMMPIPPLDGSRLILGLLPERSAIFYAKLEPYGIFIVIALFSTGIFQKTIWPFVMLSASYLGVR